MSVLRAWIAKQTIGKADDIKEMGERLANEWDLMVGQLEALGPNDPEGEQVLRAASELLQVLTTTFGPISGWTLTAHHLLYRTGKRVWGPDQRIVSKPNWTEAV